MLIRIISLVVLFVAISIPTFINAENAQFIYPKKKPSVFKKINKKILPIKRPVIKEKITKLNNDILLPKNKPTKQVNKNIIKKKEIKKVEKKEIKKVEKKEPLTKNIIDKKFIYPKKTPKSINATAPIVLSEICSSRNITPKKIPNIGIRNAT